ncbi:alkaline phosphatase family protein [Streptomyces sp. NPDC005202]|uniref:alkaline phosphatase family protein n=1 Tax=Streptomyces sp. NPDC005202 TaxID=3157021 RepID=UPI0033A5E4EC
MRPLLLRDHGLDLPEPLLPARGPDGPHPQLHPACTLPTIWDRLRDAGLRGRYYYYDVPFTALWGSKYKVSFVDPKFLDEGTGSSADDHPHADIRAGQSFLNQVYNAVTSGPAWERTMLVINYDEWCGFLDHVAPSVAPDAHPDCGLRGFRTPCLVSAARPPQPRCPQRL